MVKKLLEYKALMEYIKNNSCFEINNNVLYCNLCDEIKEYNPREGIRLLKKHVQSKKHLAAAKLGVEQQRLKILPIDSEIINTFHYKLVEALISANIPLAKLQNEQFKLFLEIYTGKKLKSVSHYRDTIVKSIYVDKLQDMKYKFENIKNYYVIFDESTDACGRYILNLLIGECNNERRTRPYFLGLVKLDKVNADSVTSAIIKKFAEFFNNDMLKFEKIKLLLSDAAPYAIKAGKILKELFPDLKHITCLCHGLHNLCETIRNTYCDVDRFVALSKLHWLKIEKSNSFSCTKQI